VALLDLAYDQLEALLVGWGEPRFRADQVWGWLYRSLVTSPEEMRNLPKPLRARLARETAWTPLVPVRQAVSGDGSTRKVLFRLMDGQTIETVLMAYRDEAAHDEGKGDNGQRSARERHTVCVSTQVGCAMGCVFCATGQMGLARDLTPGEIVAQVLHFERELRTKGGRVTNVVFMGMGEPMTNFDATWQAVETLNDARGFGLGARRMTISTVGVVPGIRRLSQVGLQVNLAVSLHAADNPLRDQLVPVNRRWPIGELMTACREYVDRTHRRVTFEYALMDGVNDDPRQAHALADLLEGLLCHVNLIPLNPTAGSPYRPSPSERVSAFKEVLTRRGINTTVRARKGVDIQAGCGQLRTEIERRRASPAADEGSQETGRRVEV
jgi:23S rRNA (adenine2503-C2)-methyltransferase